MTVVIQREVVKHRMQSVIEEFNTHCLEFRERVGGWEDVTAVTVS